VLITWIPNELHIEDTQENATVPFLTFIHAAMPHGTNVQRLHLGEIRKTVTRDTVTLAPEPMSIYQRTLASSPELPAEATWLRKQVAALGFSPPVCGNGGHGSNNLGAQELVMGKAVEIR
jgi:hypothetical protein